MDTQTITTHDPCPVCGGFDSAHWTDSGPGYDAWTCRCGHDFVIQVKEPKGADLATALAEDDAAEDKGMHANDRKTCWQCRSWADHAHDPLSNARISLDEYEAGRTRRGF